MCAEHVFLRCLCARCLIADLEEKAGRRREGDDAVCMCVLSISDLCCLCLFALSDLLPCEAKKVLEDDKAALKKKLQEAEQQVRALKKQLKGQKHR